MAKIKHFHVQQIERVRMHERLCRIVSTLKNVDDISNFFLDLLTPSEVLMLGRRLEIAGMLLEGDSFSVIQKKLNVGVSTITHVERWLARTTLQYGKLFSKVLETESKEEKINIRKTRSRDPYSWGHFKKQYAQYYWPELLVKEIDELVFKHKHSLKKRTKSRI